MKKEAGGEIMTIPLLLDLRIKTLVLMLLQTGIPQLPHPPHSFVPSPWYGLISCLILHILLSLQ